MYLERIARDLQKILGLLTQSTNARLEAESEIPEKMRRFSMYMHDIRDILYMYHETGQPPPEYVMAEARRCDDRYRHLLQDLNTDTGAFEKVRQEMSQREGNRWDHSRLFPKQEAKDETGSR
jgi:hypothetical protein